eukprot:s3189_g1.t1
MEVRWVQGHNPDLIVIENGNEKDPAVLLHAHTQADADAGGGPAPRKKSGGKEENGDKEGDKENDDSDDKEEDKPDDKEEDDEDGDDEDGEKTRTQFVDLLMKAKEISAGTTYEETCSLCLAALVQ